MSDRLGQCDHSDVALFTLGECRWSYRRYLAIVVMPVFPIPRVPVKTDYLKVVRICHSSSFSTLSCYSCLHWACQSMRGFWMKKEIVLSHTVIVWLSSSHCQLKTGDRCSSRSLGSRKEVKWAITICQESDSSLGVWEYKTRLILGYSIAVLVLDITTMKHRRTKQCPNKNDKNLAW